MQKSRSSRPPRLARLAPLAAPLADIAEALGLGEAVRARTMLDELDPGADAATDDAADSLRRALRAKVGESLLPGRYPVRAAIGPGGRLRCEPVAEMVLAVLDGRTTVEALVRMVPLAPERTLGVLADLIERGAVELSETERPSRRPAPIE
jgi:hypothetical protein